MKTFEKVLPNGYAPAFVIDAKDKKFAVGINAAAMIIMLGFGVGSYFIIKPQNYYESFNFLRSMIFAVSIFAYMVLHEIVHGIAYKALTREKLTFGVTFSVAYCGVPNIFVYRKTAFIALLAPSVTFTVIFALLIFLFQNNWDKFYTAILMGIHIGGCAGDLYATILLCFKFKDPNTLLEDTGPKQTFYVKG